MSDYISREAALTAILGQPPDAHYPGWYAAQIRALPAADVRPVVRCKVCVHRGDGEEVDDSCWCYEACQVVGEDDFCSHGQRRETVAPNCGADMREEEDV